jgi:hypothetical protein
MLLIIHPLIPSLCALQPGFGWRSEPLDHHQARETMKSGFWISDPLSGDFRHSCPFIKDPRHQTLKILWRQNDVRAAFRGYWLVCSPCFKRSKLQQRPLNMGLDANWFLGLLKQILVIWGREQVRAFGAYIIHMYREVLTYTVSRQWQLADGVGYHGPKIPELIQRYSLGITEIVNHMSSDLLRKFV